MYSQVKALYSQGHSQRSIAKMLSINRRTVAKYIKMISHQTSIPLADKSNHVSGFNIAEKYIKEILHTSPAVQVSILYKQVIERYPEIKLSSRAFYDYIKKLKQEQYSSHKDRDDGSSGSPLSCSDRSPLTNQCIDVKGDNELNIGDNIARYRQAASLTKKQLAELVNVSPMLISYYEAGKRKPSISSLLRIANVTQIPVEYYLTNKEVARVKLDEDDILETILKVDKEFNEKNSFKETEPSQDVVAVNKPLINNVKKTNCEAQVNELIIKAESARKVNPKKCIDYAEEALQVSQQTNYPIGIGKAYFNMGLGYYYQSCYAKALKNYFLAELAFKNEQYIEGLKETYNNIGVIYYYWDDLDKALDYFQKSLNLKTEATDPKLYCEILNNIGSIYRKYGNNELALKYCKEALSITEKHHFIEQYPSYLNNVGSLYSAEGDYDNAEQMLLKSLEASKKMNDPIGLSISYINLAKLKADKQLFSESRKHLKKSLKYAQSVEDHLYLAKTYLIAAYVSSMIQEKEQQREYLEKCVDIAEANNFKSVLLSAYQRLTGLSEGRNDFRLSNEYYKKILKIKDFLNNEKRTRAIEEIKTKMEVDRILREKKILQLKNFELQQLNSQVINQKKKLEKAEKELTDINHNLELRVQEEINKRRRQERIVIQKSKLESLGRMAAGVAHEINQPLGLIQMATQNLFQKKLINELTPEYIDQKSSFVLDNITRIKKIIDHIRLFSRNQKDIEEEFCVSEALEGAFSLINTQFRNDNIRISKDIKIKRSISVGNKFKLEQVLINLLSNAKDALDCKFDAYDDKKQIILKAHSKGEKIVISVEDNGCGIDKTIVNQVFEPFFTTKDENKGTGLGLSICYGIIGDMGGKITINSEKGKYTQVILELPVSQ